MNEVIGGELLRGGRFGSKWREVKNHLLFKGGIVALAASAILLSAGLTENAEAAPCAWRPVNLTAWWSFDDANNLGRDLMGANVGLVNNNGTPSGQPQPKRLWFSDTYDYIGDWVYFDGIDDSFSVPNHPEIDVDRGDFSLDFWMRTTKSSGVQTIVDKRVSSPYRGYSVFLYNGVIGLQLADGVPDPLNNNATWTNYVADPVVVESDGYTPPHYLADGEWHHVAVTVDRDNSKGIKFYTDGNLIAERNPTGRQGRLTNSAPLRMGVNSFGGYRYRGDLDELDFIAQVMPELKPLPGEGYIDNIVSFGSWGKCRPPM